MVSVAYERSSLTRGSKYCDSTWKLSVFWKTGHLRKGGRNRRLDCIINLNNLYHSSLGSLGRINDDSFNSTKRISNWPRIRDKCYVKVLVIGRRFACPRLRVTEQIKMACLGTALISQGRLETILHYQLFAWSTGCRATRKYI